MDVSYLKKLELLKLEFSSIRYEFLFEDCSECLTRNSLGLVYSNPYLNCKTNEFEILINMKVVGNFDQYYICKLLAEPNFWKSTL